MQRPGSASAVKYFLFDLMDTIVVDPFHNLIANLLPPGMSFDEWRSCRERAAFEDFEKGLISESEYFHRFYLQDLPESVKARLMRPQLLKTKLYEKIEFVHGMHDLLVDLKGKATLAILSNYGPWYSEVLRLRPELEDLFDFLFFSCEIGHRKPEPGFYGAVHEALHLEGRDAVFIDDREENLTEAARLGWKTHRFAGTKGLSQWISSL
ncbi:MAG: HAD-IA family hydrolase [Leptospirales bacterium]|nr:HAD-IA family hydrolase [Leptospirales bacterium]HMU81736.1 HAD-IA family hydrolase [Leptospiraceae bacterium]HNJ02800.1 HAD-IA family hydrolase [Leptospiraceae bacterium]HNL69012.1 HAD-IA family hydrolase [Leptospiraceae bacterium]HQI19905.1 HAD-IA family hydrolase [Leptospiraceae bacterium]